MRSIKWMIIIGMLINPPILTASTTKQDVSCSITIASPQLIDSGIHIDFAITNNQDKNIELLSWYTPFEGFLSNLFKIKDASGNLINYQGIMVKRLSPESTDFLLIPAKTTHAIQLNLTKAYSLIPGDYQIELVYQRLRYKSDDNTLHEFICAPESLNIQVK